MAYVTVFGIRYNLVDVHEKTSFFDIYIINVIIPTQGIKFQGSDQKMEKNNFLTQILTTTTKVQLILLHSLGNLVQIESKLNDLNMI